MRKIILFPLIAGLGWAGLTAAAVTQQPTVEVAAAPACTAEADTWAMRLTEHGFDVVRKTQADTAVEACLSGRAAGFDLEGAVPAEAVERLVRKRPRGITGLTVVDTADSGVMTLNRDGTRSAFTPAPGKG